MVIWCDVGMWEGIDNVSEKGKRQFRKLPDFFLCFAIPIFFFLSTIPVHGQDFGGATRIYTDFGGYWTSGIDDINTTLPDNTHHLLGFTWNEIVYSTGVDDANLTAQAVNFEPHIYQAFPVRNIKAKSSGTYIGLGQLFDGKDNAISSPAPFDVPPNLASFLTRGIRGLDYGSGIANIAAGNIIFDFTGIIDETQIGDGIPDILVTQFAQPSSILDEIFMTDADGNVIGNSLTINHENIDPVGRWSADFYQLDGLATNVFIKTTRDLRLWVADLSAFGIHSGNFHEVRSMRYRLNGTSDPAFAAYKVGVFDIVSANNDQDSTFQEFPVVVDVLANDLPREILDLSTLSIESPPSNGSVEIDLVTGEITYLPNKGFTGTDLFRYEICGSSELQCAEAEVSITVISNALPVKLFEFFTAYHPDIGVTVNWTTASEEDNKYFEIQASQDGLSWSSVGKVTGSMTTTEKQTYSFVHEMALPGNSFYRIKQVDLNGGYSFSWVVNQRIPKEANKSLVLYPNPTERFVYFQGKDLGRDYLIVINSFGMQVHADVTLESASSHLYKIDLNNLPKGIYILKNSTFARLIQKI
ncbi:Ig-like domain-containing protein [Lunatibacter salilacus]|uniref:Ig-like domain-containing protein n=1 Tax=Lunatibacter salilacus TaxID=2483804 RepID=UPI00131E5782|nr:Ig-like domain-containing protein [Lunatibacter salilacus]